MHVLSLGAGRGDGMTGDETLAEVKVKLSRLAIRCRYIYIYICSQHVGQVQTNHTLEWQP